jgi:hypothetical protein
MMFEGRSAIGYDHGYDARVFYLGLALIPTTSRASLKGAWIESGRIPRRMEPRCVFSGRTT